MSYVDFLDGATGGGTERWNYLGATTSETLDRAALANTLYLQKITAPVGGITVRKLFLRQRQTTGAGIHVKAMIYSDNTGPDALLNTSAEVTTISRTFDWDIPFDFGGDVNLAAGDYWIGYIADGAFKADGNNATSTLYSVAATYASGPPTNPTGFATNAAGIVCYVSAGDATVLAGTGIQGYNTISGQFDKQRILLSADRKLGDIAFIHVTFTNGSGPPTWVPPDGYTLIDMQNIQAPNYRELLYYRRIDGTEGIIDIGQTGATTAEQQVTPSLWRGYTAVGTPYEAFATSTGLDTTPQGSAVVTLGANRTVVNFYSDDQVNSNGVPGNAGANGWADAYGLPVTSGPFECCSTCSWKDAAVAGALGAEMRSFTVANRWRSFTLALIKA